MFIPIPSLHSRSTLATPKLQKSPSKCVFFCNWGSVFAYCAASTITGGQEWYRTENQLYLWSLLQTSLASYCKISPGTWLLTRPKTSLSSNFFPPTEASVARISSSLFWNPEWMRFRKRGWVAISLKQRRRWRLHGRTDAVLTLTDAVSCNVNSNSCCNCSCGCWAADVGGCSQTSTSTLLQVQSQRGKLCHSSGGKWCELRVVWCEEESGGASREVSPHSRPKSASPLDRLQL